MNAAELARAIRSELGRLERRDTPALRALRRRHTRALAQEAPELLLALATELLKPGDFAGRMLGYELLAAHRGGIALIDDKRIERLGKGLADWGSVDLFGVTLVGPAWRLGRVSDDKILQWARSPDRWRRRLSLVATVRLNSKTGGGTGDPRRTLRIAKLHVADRDDMVEKALSWALRELAQREPAAVQAFLREQGERLAARVRREVKNKLETGLKNPKLRSAKARGRSPAARSR
jgi:3-methyladenine DNA glycosylase AlkD